MPSAFLVHDGELLRAMIRLEGDDGTIGDALVTIGPGGSWLGVSYDELRVRGEGEIEITDAMLRELA